MNREETLSHVGQMASEIATGQVTVERRVPKNYGVRSRERFDPKRHNKLLMKSDLEGQQWCNNVIKWLVFKVIKTIVLKLIEGSSDTGGTTLFSFL